MTEEKLELAIGLQSKIDGIKKGLQRLNVGSSAVRDYGITLKCGIVRQDVLIWGDAAVAIIKLAKESLEEELVKSRGDFADL